MTLLLLLVPSLAAAAQGSVGSGIGFQGWGLRAGLGVDPDQGLFGVQWDLGEFTRNLRFQPDIEIGLGDDVLTVYGTAPVHYVFDVDGSFRPYAGGGIALGLVNVDEEADDPPFGSDGEDDTEFEAGARAIGGLQWERKNGKPFAVEANFGVGDVHDFQVKVWWNW
jgi:opacity protein-like surface antigen